MDVFDLSGKSIFEASPKKKKKYILFLYTHSHDNEEKIRMMEKAIQKTLKNFVLVRLEEPDEGLKALIVKNIEIVVIDSSLFNDDLVAVDYALECKKRKKCPVLFVAKDPQKLIHEYRQKLYAYEEFDNYFNDPVDIAEFTKKLQQVGSSQGRTAKRFSLSIPIKLYRLNTNSVYSVTLTDISLVGFGVLLDHTDIFTQNEQVQIKVPLSLFKIFHEQYGEFLPLSGKLRRLSINGESLGFSIEFVTPMQVEVLCDILSVINYKSKLSRLSEKPKEIVAGVRKMNSSDLI